MGRQQVQRQHKHKVPQDEVPQDAKIKPGLDEDVDALLEEIDSVLESNAQEFVEQYVQKGGQ